MSQRPDGLVQPSTCTALPAADRKFRTSRSLESADAAPNSATTSGGPVDGYSEPIFRSALVHPRPGSSRFRHQGADEASRRSPLDGLRTPAVPKKSTALTRPPLAPLFPVAEPPTGGPSELRLNFDDDRNGSRGYDREVTQYSMQVSDLLHSSPLSVSGGRETLAQRIKELGRAELDKGDRERVAGALGDEAKSSEELRDAVSTALMDGFRKHTGRGTFGLLYELNAAHLLIQVAGRLRRYSSKADAGDVLQEVFFNVYRYPHRFDAGREDAFRVWTAMIVRNTVLKHLRSRSTGSGNRREIPFEDLSDQPVAHGETPLTGALNAEANAECSRAYVTYLQLYIEFYGMLSERERKALYLVEVENVSYRDAAAVLGIKLENLKMVIFRARKKIHRAMRRVFDGLSPDCKPARVGRVSDKNKL